MASLKDVQIKIGAVKKTRQITKAMNMVATSRLRNAQMNMEAFRPYAGKFGDVLGSLAGKSQEEENPLLTPKQEVKKIHIVLCTSDRGLCGGFNTNLIDKTILFLKEKSEQHIGCEFSFTNFGKKGRDWCRKNGHEIVAEHVGVIGNVIRFNTASTAGKKLVDAFLDNHYDEIYIIYSEFVNVARQMPTIKQILPIPPIESKEEDQPADENVPYMAEHICEPSPEELLNDLLPRSVYVELFRALLESSTSDHAARMTAMDNATQACNDMLDNLTLAYNKARQAAITAELMDIVGGAEALKG